MTDNLTHDPASALIIEQAAQWLSEQKEPPNPAVPALRSRFNLSAVEACEVIALARCIQVNRKAFG